MKRRLRGGSAPPSLEHRRQNEKHTLSVEEHLSILERERKKKASRPKRVPLDGFTVLSEGAFHWRGGGFRGGLNTLPENPTRGDIFYALTPDSAITAMLEKMNSTITKYRHGLTIRDVREYWAVRIFIQSSTKKKWRDNFPLPPQLFSNGTMGHGRYQRLQQVWICPEAVEKLNSAAQALVKLPEVVTMDEKLVPFEGESPFFRYVPNKDPNWGHWISETTIKGRKTGLPYLVNAFPVQQNSGPTMLEFYQHALNEIPAERRPSIVVVSDAYYLDDQSRTWLRDSGFKYLMAVNPTPFKEVWDPLKLKVKHIGEFAVAWNQDTREVAVHYWSPENGKIYLLTNAFSYRRSPTPLSVDIFYDTYKFIFNTADRLNHFLANKMYPHRRNGWQFSFDDFHFTTILWNTYTIYHEYYELQTNEDWVDFCIALAQELWNKRVNQ
jgi:hypothetical protein